MIPKELKDKAVAFLKANGFAIVIVSICALVALVSLIWLPADNPIEQAAEKEIEVLTGYHVDFTPDGPTAPPAPEMPKGMNGPAGPM